MAVKAGTPLAALAAILVAIVCAAAVYLGAPSHSELPLSPSRTPSPSPLARPVSEPNAFEPAVTTETKPPVAASQGVLPWERQVLDVLNNPGSDGKARALFGLLPTLPPQALGPTTERALEWVKSSDYATTARPLIVNSKTHGAVLSVLFADLMERPDAIALPTLLAIAKNSDHPFAPNARDNLAYALGQDFQSDWPAWDAAISQHLQGR